MQLDLFSYQLIESEVQDGLRRESSGELLNGFYYETNSRLFVSYCQGVRHWEGTGKGFDPEWKITH